MTSTLEDPAFARDVLPAYLAGRRWFATKDDVLDSARVTVTASLGVAREITLTQVDALHSGLCDRYFLPLCVVWDDEGPAELATQLALARVEGARPGYLTDAFTQGEFIHELLVLLKAGSALTSLAGTLDFRPTPAFAHIHIAPDAPVRWLSAEQSNSSTIVDRQVMLKVFRRLSSGEHPEAEMSRLLTERGFANSAPLMGEIVHVSPDGTQQVLAVVQGFIAAEGDGWSWTLDFLSRALEELSAGEDIDTVLTPLTAFAEKLGMRLGEMHDVLAQGSDNPDFAPVLADSPAIARWDDRIGRRFRDVVRRLQAKLEGLTPRDRRLAEAILDRRQRVLDSLHCLAQAGQGALLHRIHGDFHLGQVLVAHGDAVIIDFEGEPTLPLAERRAKDSGWRDVAGILRSLDYALAAGRPAPDSPLTGAYDTLAETISARIPACLLAAYQDAAGLPQGGGDQQRDSALLRLFLMEKAAYEVLYELNNRPDWLTVPLTGLARLVDAIAVPDTGDAA